ncbi:MAG: WXG100 family type VII secretion target [Lachnospiraceae bacterium]|nr:WXG100 family type VII secretion target [Lachnospiraceae bacterium]
MADMTNVDAAKLRQTASKIGSLASQLNSNVTKINEALNNLTKSWQSEAATKFMQNWRTDEEALKEMVEQYREVQDIMNELAQDFASSEQEAEGLVGKLKM